MTHTGMIPSGMTITHPLSELVYILDIMVWEAITDTDTPIIITGILFTMIIMDTIHPITTVAIMDIHLTIMGMGMGMDMDITVMPIKKIRIMDAAWIRPPTVGAKWVQEQIWQEPQAAELQRHHPRLILEPIRIQEPGPLRGQLFRTEQLIVKQEL